jgi:molecular chaperone DnaK (HSP70)
MVKEAILQGIEGTYVGIDLGTTNSVVSYFKNGQIDQVLFRGRKVLPSVIYFDKIDRPLFGDIALKKGAVNPQYLLREFKRDLGTSTKYSLTFEDNQILDEVEKNYIIDTNIFIDEPKFLKEFNQTDSIKLPLKVIDELHNLSKRSELEISSNLAIKSIESLKTFLDISFENSDLSLLPDDIERNSKNSENDNKILSIAKQFSDLNPETYLITNDSGLKLKAEIIKVKVLNLTEFRSKKSREELKKGGNTLNLTPKDASRLLLQHLKEESEKYLGEYIDKAVITVPANFTPLQITHTKEAGEEAGFKEIKIQKEPIAVGIAYALDSTQDKTILVFDFGGGTFDASILEIKNGKIGVLGTDGNNKLGGKDITKKLKEMIYDKLLENHDFDMYDKDSSGLNDKDFSSNSNAIYSEAEKCKIELSDRETVSVNISNLIISSNGDKINLDEIITRREFENEIAEIRRESLNIITNLINQLGLTRNEISEIVLAGGTSNIPSIKKSLTDTIGIVPTMTRDNSTVISEGAVIDAMRNWGSNVIDEKIMVNDIALKSFGVAIKNQSFFELIPVGTSLPCRISKDFQTERNNQEVVKIQIYNHNNVLYPNSEKTFDKGMSFISEIELSGIPQAKVGELTVRVNFELSKDDSLEVSTEILNKNGVKVCNGEVKTKGLSNV